MKSRHIKYIIGFLALFLVLAFLYTFLNSMFGTVRYSKTEHVKVQNNKQESLKDKVVEVPKLDTVAYDKRLLALVHYSPPVPISVLSTSTDANGKIVKHYATSTPPSPLVYASSTNVTISGKLWPKSQPYPLAGAVLPFKRIVSYYGNFYSTKMGILGELAPDQMLARLASTRAEWEAADPTTPVLPAIEYIAEVAQGYSGVDGKYRAVMPDAEIEKAYALAQKINGVMILDVQVGLSSVSVELPKFKKFLERPDVFFALDPEFSMKGGQKPGTIIGTFSATDINYTIDYMTKIVQENNLPPKVLLVHRFTPNMVTGANLIKATPEVQVVVVMDGWGSKDLKRGTYKAVIKPEPVQFSGIKIFYKNDLKAPSTGLLTPKDVLDLNPTPVFVQYQ